MRQDTAKQADPRLDVALIERERNRFGARALGFLILLNGGAALVLLSVLGRAAEGSIDSKMATAMLFFSMGAVAALLSSFLAYLNRTIALEAPDRRDLRRGLQIVGILAVVCSAAAFLTGMNMVGSAASERSSSHPKGPKEQQRPQGDPAPAALPSESERVEAPTPAAGGGVTSFAVHASAEPA